MQFISPTDLRQLIIKTRDEYAIIDVREEGSFAENHLLLASNAPLSRLELVMPTLVPRKNARVILCDEHDSDQKLARRAFETLSAQGYSDLQILRGGIAAWENASFELYSGIHVLSKAFGEYVEETYATPHITANELARDLDATSNNVVVIDSRPQEEFARMSVPGAINIPGAELVHRIQEVVPNPETLVVINCAGRTRSIIGAQSLINAGLVNSVVALENGTMGWHLSGFPLATNRKNILPQPKIEGCRWAKKAAQEVARRTSLNSVSWEEIGDWITNDPQKTVYLFDVRTPEEFCSGHIYGSVNAPGGQLVQTTDKFIGTHGAIIILTCDSGTRARMTASWLVQMGRKNVFVLNTDYEEHVLEQGPGTSNTYQILPPDPSQLISAETLSSTMNNGRTAILDFADSREYKRGHIPEAWFVVRSDLDRCLHDIPVCDLLVLTSPDGKLAALAHGHFENQVGRNVVCLDGGTKSWMQMGYALSKGPERMISPENDVYQLPYDYGPNNVEEQMKAYLVWETGLLDRIKKDDSVCFSDLQD